MVSRCLSAVFREEAYEFKILFEKKRNRTEARIEFARDKEGIDPLTASGGGVVDVAAFALRLAVLLMKHPQPRRVMILDEPFRFVSTEYRPYVAALLQTLADELKFQFILITHITDLEIGKIVRISK